MRSSVQALLVLAAVAVCGSSAWALPPNQIVTYTVRETPSNPNSDVLIEHELFLMAFSQHGDDISWKFAKLEFVQPGVGTWRDASPGLPNWVVTHADPNNPVASDFTSPPAMSGTAVAFGSPNDDLEYSSTPGICDSIQEELYSGDVTCATYDYAAASTIAHVDEDEPEEIDSENDPS